MRHPLATKRPPVYQANQPTGLSEGSFWLLQSWQWRAAPPTLAALLCGRTARTGTVAGATSSIHQDAVEALADRPLPLLAPLREEADQQYDTGGCKEEAGIDGAAIGNAGREPGRWQAIQEEEAEAEQSRACGDDGRQQIEEMDAKRKDTCQRALEMALC